MVKASCISTYGLCILLSACVGIVDDPEATLEQLREDQGAVELTLTTVGASGTVYRLRYAVFSLSGPQQIRVSTREDLATRDDDALTTPLLVGQYTVTLEPGWQLLRVATDGSEQGVAAAITSPNPQSLTVASRQKSALDFHFRITSGEALAFGDAQIGIAVDEPSGTLFFTDGPSTWHKSDPDTLTDLRVASAPANLVGIAVGVDGVYTASQSSPTGPSTLTFFDFAGAERIRRDHGSPVRDVAIDTGHSRLFVADEQPGIVTVFDSDHLLPLERLNVPVSGGFPVIAYDPANDRLYFAARGTAGPILYIERPSTNPGPVSVSVHAATPVFELTVDDAGTLYWVSNNAVFRKRMNDLEPTKLFATAPSDVLRCVEADAVSGHVFVGVTGSSTMLATYTASGVRIAQRPVLIADLCGVAFWPAPL